MKKGAAIIGAGTAGLIAARALSDLGIETAVYDQKKILGVPVRASGILSVKGLRELGISYNRAITNTLYGANIHAGKEAMKLRAARPMAHVLDRKMLNDLCHDEAVAKGAEVFLERRIGGRQLDELSRNRIIIGADGAVSQVATHFSMGKIRKYCLTYKAEYNISPDEHDMVSLFFDNKISKGLFGWTCPNSKNILEVGIGIDSQSGNAKNAFEKFLATKAIQDKVGGLKPIGEGASIIPMSLREKIVDKKSNVLLVGDAAGQVKPSTGGGIIYGGNAAMLAGQVIKEHLQDGTSLEEYSERYKARYQLDTMIHSVANSFYSNISAEGLAFAIKLFKAIGIDSLLSSYGDMDMPSLIPRNFIKRTNAQNY